MLQRVAAVAGLIAITAITTPYAFAQSPGGSLDKIIRQQDFHDRVS